MRRDRAQTVLRVRGIQERSARGALAAARAGHRRAIDDEATTWSRVDSLGTLVAAQVTSTQLQQCRLMADAGSLAAHSLRDVTRTAAAGVDRARIAWAEAATRVEVLERLSQRLDEREAAETAHVAQITVEDLVLARRVAGGHADAPMMRVDR